MYTIRFTENLQRMQFYIFNVDNFSNNAHNFVYSMYIIITKNYGRLVFAHMNGQGRRTPNPWQRDSWEIVYLK